MLSRSVIAALIAAAFAAGGAAATLAFAATSTAGAMAAVAGLALVIATAGVVGAIGLIRRHATGGPAATTADTTAPDPMTQGNEGDSEALPGRPQDPDTDTNPFRAMVCHAVTGFLVLAPNRSPVFANAAMARLLGLESPDALVQPPATGAEAAPQSPEGRPDAETAAMTEMSHGLWPFLPDRERQHLLGLHADLISGNTVEHQARMEVVRRDRGTAWMDVTARALPWNNDRAVLLTFLDVTDLVLHERDMEFHRLDMENRAVELVGLAEDYNQERERAETARRHAEEQRRFLEALILTIPNPLFYKDTKGRIRGCNKTFAMLYGRDDEADIIGLTSHDLAPAPYADKTDQLDAELLTKGGAVRYERVFTPGREGDRHLIFNKAVYTDAAGETAGIVGVVTDITEQKRLEDELRRLATTDPLTGVPNRRAFMDESRRHISRAERHEEPLSLILADLDHFKRVNDTHGHAVGDEVLKAFVGVVRPSLRESDMMARMGGEEFAILLPHTTLDQATVLAERLRLNLASTSLPKAAAALSLAENAGGKPLSITVSMGLAELGRHGRIIDTLLQAADEALYAAKARGRNRVMVAADAQGHAQEPSPTPVH